MRCCDRPPPPGYVNSGQPVKRGACHLLPPGPDTYDFPEIHSGDMCYEMSSTSGCAGSCKDATTSDYARVAATIASIEDASATLLNAANSTACPMNCDYCSYSYAYEE